MQVQTINSYNSQTNFGAILRPQNVTWNKKQKPIVEIIKKTMREPLTKFNGDTAEYFYEKKGFDFEIKPQTQDSVYLTAFKNLKEVGKGADRKLESSDAIKIGEYNKNSKFKVSDIEKATKEKRKNDIWYSLALLTTGLAIMAIAFQEPIQKLGQKIKPTAEVVDSTVNKAKIVLSDTTKVLKTIKK